MRRINALLKENERLATTVDCLLERDVEHLATIATAAQFARYLLPQRLVVDCRRQIGDDDAL